MESSVLQHHQVHLELRHRPAALFRWRIPRGTLLQLLHRGTSMSISGILSSGFLQKPLGAPSPPNKQSIEQLSKDLQSGNLAAAQSDFSTLQKAFAPSVTSAASASAASTSNPVAQAFNQLATDLKSGNLSAAQKDFSVLQQDVENLRGSGSSNPV